MNVTNRRIYRKGRYVGMNACVLVLLRLRIVRKQEADGTDITGLTEYMRHI